MNIKLFVLLSVLLDQLLMFLVYSVNFMFIFLFNELELSLLRLQLHIHILHIHVYYMPCNFLNTHPVNLASCHIFPATLNYELFYILILSFIFPVASAAYSVLPQMPIFN